jgi:hypothetical protein
VNLKGIFLRTVSSSEVNGELELGFGLPSNELLKRRDFFLYLEYSQENK